MKQTEVRDGADLVVLTMSVGVVVSFLCAVFNGVFGARYVYITALLLVAFAALWYYLDTHAHPNWALLVAALSAGTLYALAAGLIERLTGFRVVSAMAEQVTFVMVPPLSLIFLALGTIFICVATPTEGVAMISSRAFFLALLR